MSACKKWTFDRIAKVINIKKVNEEPSVDLQIEMFLIFFHFPHSAATLVPHRAYNIYIKREKERTDWTNVLALLFQWMNRPYNQPTDRSTEQKNYESNPSIVCCMLYAERSKFSNLKGAFREVQCIPNSKNSYEYESVSAFYVYFRCEIFGPLHVFFVCLIEDVHLFTCFPRPSLANASIRSSDSPRNSVFLFTFMLSSIIGFFFFLNKFNGHV